MLCCNKCSRLVKISPKKKKRKERKGREGISYTEVETMSRVHFRWSTSDWEESSAAQSAPVAMPPDEYMEAHRSYVQKHSCQVAGSASDPRTGSAADGEMSAAEESGAY